MVEGISRISRKPLNHQQPPGPQRNGDGARDQGFTARSGFTPQANLQAMDIAKEFPQLGLDPLPQVGPDRFLCREAERPEDWRWGLGFHCEHE
jgi:hypothetical protein